MVRVQRTIKTGAWVVVVATQEVHLVELILQYGYGRTQDQVAVVRMISMDLRTMQL